MSSKLNDFEIIKKLGEGSFSSVYKVKRKSDSLFYALKKERENALNEVRILASINDPFIIGYKDAFIDENLNILCIIMEFAEAGDLQQILKQYMEKKKAMAVEISTGLSVLHSMNILHRDLKCANIFLSKGESDFKLADLNVAKVAAKGLVYTQTGTPYYASPEVWRDEPYDHKSDIWSLGCILYELASFKPPFRGNDLPSLFKSVQKGNYEPLPKIYSKDLSLMIGQFLQVNANLRPNCRQILQEPLVLKNAKEFLEEAQKRSGGVGELLGSIRFDKKKNFNIREIQEKLPKPQYKRTFEDKKKRAATASTTVVQGNEINIKVSTNVNGKVEEKVIKITRRKEEEEPNNNNEKKSKEEGFEEKSKPKVVRNVQSANVLKYRDVIQSGNKFEMKKSPIRVFAERNKKEESSDSQNIKENKTNENKYEYIYKNNDNKEKIERYENKIEIAKNINKIDKKNLDIIDKNLLIINNQKPVDRISRPNSSSKNENNCNYNNDKRQRPLSSKILEKEKASVLLNQPSKPKLNIMLDKYSNPDPNKNYLENLRAQSKKLVRNFSANVRPAKNIEIKKEQKNIPSTPQRVVSAQIRPSSRNNNKISAANTPLLNNKKINKDMDTPNKPKIIRSSSAKNYDVRKQASKVTLKIVQNNILGKY